MTLEFAAATIASTGCKFLIFMTSFGVYVFFKFWTKLKTDS